MLQQKLQYQDTQWLDHQLISLTTKCSLPQRLLNYIIDQFKIYASLGATQMVKNLMDKRLIDLDELMKYVKQ